MHVQRLEWDTDFFGFPIGRLVVADGDERAGLDTVRASVDAAGDAGIRCIYAKVDPVHRELVITLNQSGFLLVEVAMEMLHPTSISDFVPPTDSVVRFGTPADVADLDDQIALMAPWSRFAMDPRFGPEAARRMHRAWAERAAGPAPDRWLVVAEDAEGISGFSTMSMLADDHPRVDLMASNRAGSGTGEAMIDFAFTHFGPPVRSWGGPIAARNLAPLRFCEHIGYRLGRVSYLYHRWLD